MASTRREFDAEFRARAVRIARESGKPIAQVAHDLGIDESTLSNWVDRDRSVLENVNRCLSESERAELIRLRRENFELAMEVDLLRREIALWMREARRS